MKHYNNAIISNDSFEFECEQLKTLSIIHETIKVLLYEGYERFTYLSQYAVLLRYKYTLEAVFYKKANTSDMHEETDVYFEISAMELVASSLFHRALCYIYLFHETKDSAFAEKVVKLIKDGIEIYKIIKKPFTIHPVLKKYYLCNTR